MKPEIDLSEERRMWEQEVSRVCRGRCANCGSDDNRLRARMIVPEEAGGLLRASNGTLLCRACDLAANAVSETGDKGRRPMNFWISRALYNRIVLGLETRNGFRTRAALVRFLMRRYSDDPERYDDLELYAGAHSREVKINVWVAAGLYAQFKTTATNRGLSVTDALTALLLLYGEHVEPRVAERGEA